MTTRAAARLVGLFALGLAACAGGERRAENRLYTEDFVIRVSSEPTPPRALEQIRYRVVVRDKETGEPIETGEGRIFATNEDRKSIHNGFTKGEEAGTYYTTLFFATAGSWAMGIQFRRDSTQQLERTLDWMQDVLGATPPGK
jgi:hypothetical protein